MRGTISDAGKLIAEWAPAPEWWNVATFKEPFRLEGKKTLGYEIAEQMGWSLPDADPLSDGRRHRGSSACGARSASCSSSAGSTPARRACRARRGAGRGLRADRARSRRAPNARRCGGRGHGRERVARAGTVRGPAIPRGRAGGSGGTAVAVTEEDMFDAMLDPSAEEGVFACPEGGATLAALRMLRRSGEVKAHERVVIYDTGSGPGTRKPGGRPARAARRAGAHHEVRVAVVRPGVRCARGAVAARYERARRRRRGRRAGKGPRARHEARRRGLARHAGPSRRRARARAREHAAALVLEIDTPGGLESSMRVMAGRILDPSAR